ncbi:MAG: thioredoxin domain-containing protein [Sulfolobales archaeon]
MSAIRIKTPRRHRLSFTNMLIVSLAVWAILVAVVIYIDKPGSTVATAPQQQAGTPCSTNITARVIDISDYRELGILDSMSGYYLLYFEQKDCPGCKEVSPAIERYFSNNNAGVALVRIHIDDIFNSNQDAAFKLISRYNVLGTPTLILFHNGAEVSRQIGVFRGDQYEGLKKFIEDGLSSRSSTGGTILSPLLPLSLGFLAAISPCSLPMLALFMVVSRNPGRSIINIVKTLVSMIVVLVPISLGLGLLFTSGRLLGVSLYYSLITYIGVVTLLWGALTFIDREPMISAGGRVSLLLPILGMQCSFPFLLALLSMIPKNPVDAFIQALVFSIGYSSPYIVASMSSGKASRTIRALSTGKSAKIFKYLQGVILVSIGAYVIINGLPYIVG